MKKSIIALLFITLFSLPNMLMSQDWFGAESTGLHTVGVYAKYDGKFSLGAQYNYNKFNGPFSRPVNINLQAGIRLDEGVDLIDGELGVYQVYINNTFDQNFGLGVGLDFGAEYCPSCGDMEKDIQGAPITLTGGIDFRPGLYDTKLSLSAIADLDYLTVRIGERDENDNKTGVEIEPVKRIGIGAHWDFKHQFGRAPHLTLDYAHNFYLGKEDAAWQTFKDGNNAEDDNCDLPEQNFSLGASLSVGF